MSQNTGPRATKRKKWSTVDRDHISITAMCWEDQRGVHHTLLQLRGIFGPNRRIFWSPKRCELESTGAVLIQVTRWWRGLAQVAEIQVNIILLFIANYCPIQKAYEVKWPTCNSGNNMLLTLSLQREDRAVNGKGIQQGRPSPVAPSGRRAHETLDTDWVHAAVRMSVCL
jgi:hypothetical protein